MVCMWCPCMQGCAHTWLWLLFRCCMMTTVPHIDQRHVSNKRVCRHTSKYAFFVTLGQLFSCSCTCAIRMVLGSLSTVLSGVSALFSPCIQKTEVAEARGVPASRPQRWPVKDDLGTMYLISSSSAHATTCTRRNARRQRPLCTYTWISRHSKACFSIFKYSTHHIALKTRRPTLNRRQAPATSPLLTVAQP